jgi:hypothetical protein
MAGSVTLVSGTTNQFTVATGTQDIPNLGSPLTGTITFTSPNGCTPTEPLEVGVTYSSSTTYTVTSTGLSITTPVGSGSGIPTTNPTVTVSSGSSVMSFISTSVPAASTMWVQSCTPFTFVQPATSTMALTQPFTVNTTAQTIGAAPASCIGTQTTAGTYTGNLTISSQTPGAAASVMIPWTITITPALQACPTLETCSTTGETLTFTFSANSTAPQQQTVSLEGNGAAFSYTTSLSNGSFPAGSLTISSGASGSVQSGGTALIGVQVNPSSLTPGAYSGTITVTSSSGMLTITVNADVGNALIPTFEATSATTFTAVAPAGLTFSLPTTLPNTPVGTLDINAISSSTNVSSAAITYTTGTGWLLNTPSGACNSSMLGPSGMSNTCTNALDINTTGLAAGSYSATIKFTSTTMGVAALSIPVSLTVTTGPVFEQVTGAMAHLVASSTPTALAFAQASNEAPPTSSAQSLNLQVNAGTVSNATITPSTNTGGNWLLVCADTGGPPPQTACAPSSSAPLAMQSIGSTTADYTGYTVGVNSTNLIPGVTYTGAITVSAIGSTSFVVPVSVTVLSLTHSAPGIFRSFNGLWLLDTVTDNGWNAGVDEETNFSGNGLTPQAGDIAVAGDWSGNGVTKIGLYRPSTGTWYLDYNGNGVYDGPVIDRQYQYGGIAGDIPVVGDWTGDGVAKVGLFRQGYLWLLNLSGNGAFSGPPTNDAVFPFGGLTGCTGLPGVYSSEPTGACDIPVVGDWNHTGTAKAGIVRAAPGTSQPFLWVLDTTGAEAFGPTSTVFAFGGIAGDLPIVGDWNNSGNLNVGVFREGFFWVEDATASMPTAPAPSDTLVTFPFGGIAGDQPVVGHWVQ